MKWIVWLLLLANLGVAAFFATRAYWPAAPSPQTAALNVAQINLRGQSATRHPDGAPSSGAAAQSSALCVAWRGLRPTEVTQVRAQLKALAGEQILSFTEVPVNTRYWVVFPPLTSPLAAAAKHAELAAAGVRDTYVVKQGEWRNAISLGLYATTETAQQRTSELEAKGILGTRIERQARQGTAYYFVIRSEDPDALKSLDSLSQTYPNSQQSRIACPE
jgi:hypothetical protein